MSVAEYNVVTMSKYKDQHIIPKCYLQAWEDTETPPDQTPYVWLFSKDGDSVKKRAPKNIFTEKDIYTIEVDGGRSLVLEHGLSQLENEFSRIRKEKFYECTGLRIDEKIAICAFMAALQSRTPERRDHFKEQWERPRKMMEDMMDWAKTATPAQRLAASDLPSTSSEERGMGYEEVKDICENPMKHLLPSMIRIQTPLLYRLDMAVLCTDDDIGFITSDQPCVWSDPEGYKRPPFFRGPALCYETIQITLPISPYQCIYLNRRGVNGYIPITSKSVDELNGLTRFYAKEYFVVQKNVKRGAWFDVGQEPDDSWDKTHKKEKGG